MFGAVQDKAALDADRSARRAAARQAFNLSRDDPALARRLQREARVQARVDHPNVCRVYEVGETDEGRPYIAMEYVHGRSLKEVIARHERGVVVMGTLARAGLQGVFMGNTAERVLGTIPVEPDGSAYVELPAMRPLFFVALDENDLAVKRMQSFLTLQPGETISCVGCHEQRTQTPDWKKGISPICAKPGIERRLVAANWSYPLFS